MQVLWDTKFSSQSSSVHISTPEQEEGRGGLLNDEGSLYTVVQFQLISQLNDWITDQEDYYVV